MTKKQIIIKVFKNTGTFVTLWEDGDFKEFEKSTNGGLGECIITLARKFDYSGDDLQLDNRIEIFVSDKDTVNLTKGSNDSAKKIYSGYISQIERGVEGKRENIIVRVLGYYTKLAMDIFKSGATTSIDLATTDPSDMIMAIIDRYRAETVSPQINYRTDDIQDTSTTPGYTFKMMTYKEAVDKVISMTPANWFWYIDVDGYFYLKPAATTPTHKFIFGRHFTSMQADISMEKIRNTVLIWNGVTGVGEIYKLHTDVNSVTDYGRRVEKMFNYNSDDEATLDIIADKFIAENKDPEIVLTCKILDNNLNSLDKGYDIESIEPGDTCFFEGFDGEFKNILRENMLITNVRYTPEEVTITVKVRDSSFIGWNKVLTQRIDDNEGQDAPSAYTT